MWLTFEENKKETKILIKKDLKMEFAIEIWSPLIMHRGRLLKTDVISILNKCTRSVVLVGLPDLNKIRVNERKQEF